MFILLHLVSLDLNQLTLSPYDDEHKPASALTCMLSLSIFRSLSRTHRETNTNMHTGVERSYEHEHGKKLFTRAQIEQA